MTCVITIATDISISFLSRSLFFKTVLLWSTGWPQTHCVAQVVLELLILLPYLPKVLDLQMCATMPGHQLTFLEAWSMPACFTDGDTEVEMVSRVVHCIHEELIPGPFRTPKLADGKVPYIKWPSVCT
jgi:hypothetical protein